MFRLALAMGRTVGELLDTCSYPELLKWGKYYQREPFGEWRADVRSAQIVQMLANINRDPKRRQEPFQIKDFLLFEREKPKPKQEEGAEGATASSGLIQWLFFKAGQGQQLADKFVDKGTADDE